MRIPDSNQINPTAVSGELASARTSAQTPSTTTSADATSSSEDQVSLSSASQLIRSSAADRIDKLANLAASVRSGQYSVSSAAVSQSLISETLARSAKS